LPDYTPPPPRRSTWAARRVHPERVHRERAWAQREPAGEIPPAL